MISDARRDKRKNWIYFSYNLNLNLSPKDDGIFFFLNGIYDGYDHPGESLGDICETDTRTANYGAGS